MKEKGERGKRYIEPSDGRYDRVLLRPGLFRNNSGTFRPFLITSFAKVTPNSVSRNETSRIESTSDEDVIRVHNPIYHLLYLLQEETFGTEITSVLSQIRYPHQSFSIPF